MGPFRRFLILTVMTAAMLLGGCALGTRHVTLTYPPQEKANPGVATAEAAALPAGTRTELVVVNFADRRPHTNEIGEVQNALGMRTAAVVTESDVGQWVTQAVRFELEKAGYRVTSVARAGSSTAPTLQGEVLNLSCSAYWTYSGEVRVFVTLEENGKKLLGKEYTGKGGAGTNWGMTEKAYGESLSLALADAMRAMVRDVNQTLAAR